MMNVYLPYKKTGMKTSLLFVLALLPALLFSQKLTRKVFDYDKLISENFVACDENTIKELGNSFIAIEQNDSKEAVSISKKIYDTKKDCYQVFEVYGFSLFRSGEWFQAIEIIESGIEKFGSVPELIKRKADMSLEMFELGTGQRNIDGNSVYKANQLKYDEEQFKDENLKSGLTDLEYLMKKYNRAEEVFYVAKIRQLLTDYERSNELFKSLLNDEEYKSAAAFNIADNYISLKKFAEAETELNKLLIENPNEGKIYNKLAEIYSLQDNKLKAEEFRNKAVYYQNVPFFLNLTYSKDNFELLQFFGSDKNNAEKKLKRINEISKQSNTAYTVDVCLLILKLHANHGNGVEEKATDILAGIGRPAIEKVNKLFQTDVSTCTITGLSGIMATVKDETSWELMKAYLPTIANMPMTLLPPDLPTKMIKFDEDRGIKEILIVIKTLLSQEKSNDPLAEFSGFKHYGYYSALEKINKAKLKKIAAELNYTDKEFKQLEENIK
jgi:hypothetical protein